MAQGEPHANADNSSSVASASASGSAVTVEALIRRAINQMQSMRILMKWFLFGGEDLMIGASAIMERSYGQTPPALDQDGE